MTARLDIFAMKVNADEQRMIVNLAERLQRNRSDAVRFVIREALRALAVTDQECPGQGQEVQPCPN